MSDEPIPFEHAAIIVGENSYATLEQAEAIAAARLFTESWGRAYPNRREVALITASAALSALRWKGRPADEAQPLAWPRDRAPRSRPGPNAGIPQVVTEACAELAFHFMAMSVRPATNVQMRQLGDSLTMYFASTPDELPKHVRRLIEPLLETPSSHSADLVR